MTYIRQPVLILIQGQFGPDGNEPSFEEADYNVMQLKLCQVLVAGYQCLGERSGV